MKKSHLSFSLALAVSTFCVPLVQSDQSRPRLMTDDELMQLVGNTVSADAPSDQIPLAKTIPVEDVAPANDSVRAILVAHREATLSSRIEGRVVSIKVRDGDRFSKGDTLASFDCGIQRARVKVEKAKLNEYEVTHAANQRMLQRQAVTELDVAVSGARVDAATAQLKLAKVSIGHCTIPAPYNGRVVKVIANAHESLRKGDPVLRIIDNATPDVTVHVPSRWIGQISSGTGFEIVVDETGERRNASVVKVLPQIEASSRTVEVIARLEGAADGLVPGMTGDAFFGFE